MIEISSEVIVLVAIRLLMRDLITILGSILLLLITLDGLVSLVLLRHLIATHLLLLVLLVMFHEGVFFLKLPKRALLGVTGSHLLRQVVIDLLLETSCLLGPLGI